MLSRFAVAEDIFTKEFAEINNRLLQITDEHQLIDHREINNQRFPDWFGKIKCNRSFYGSRFWEYPFAILAAELKPGLKCADVGCGSTPFTLYLCEAAGAENVTGIDHDYVPEAFDDRHLSFGARKSHIDKSGFNFLNNDFTRIDAPDNSFDRVFCISVLEHIMDEQIKEKGLLEMVRILKPGGKLILTFDTGVNLFFNPPLRILGLTGLIPDNGLELKWPKNRFVEYGDNSMDVFGLVLQKQKEDIYSDYKKTRLISAHELSKKYIDISGSYSHSPMLMLSDLKRPWGLIRLMAKYTMGKYKQE